MLYECLKDYEGVFSGEKGHIYALSEKSIKELGINKLKEFKLLSENEEAAYIAEQSK